MQPSTEWRGSPRQRLWRCASWQAEAVWGAHCSGSAHSSSGGLTWELRQFQLVNSNVDSNRWADLPCPAPCPTLPCLQVATTGVTVNAVCPGYVMTELIEKQLVNQAKTRGIPKASWQRACVPTWLQPQALLTCIRWRVDG